MLHWFSRLADWFHETVFKDGSLPGWMKKEVPKNGMAFVVGLWMAECMVFGLCLFPELLILGMMLGALFGAITAHWYNKLHKSWLIREARIWFYSPILEGDIPSGDLDVRWISGVSFSGAEGQARILCHFPLSRIFGAPPQFHGLFFPHSQFRVRWLGATDDRALEFSGRIVNGIGSPALLALYAIQSLQGEMPLERLRSWHETRWQLLRAEMEHWLEVLRASKKGAGDPALKALALRIEHVIVRMNGTCLVPWKNAPPLIPRPKEHERRRA